MIALVYISVISGYVIPNLHPLCPNIGLNSANSCTFYLTYSNVNPISYANSYY